MSDTFRMEALSVLRSRQRAEASSAANDAAASSSTAANDGDGPITQIVTPINTHSYVNLPQRAVDDAHPGGEA